jgi:hypothetical protein
MPFRQVRHLNRADYQVTPFPPAARLCMAHPGASGSTRLPSCRGRAQQSGQAGSVRDRAIQYNRDTVERNLSSGHRNRKHGGGSAKADEDDDRRRHAGRGSADTKEIAKLIVTATKSVGGHEACKAAHTSCLSLDPAMVPFRLIVQPHIGPVCNRLAELGGDRLRG